MGILMWLLLVVVVLAAVFFVGGMMMPREVPVARSIEINSDPATVFAQINSLKAGQAWSPWSKRDPDMKVEFKGPDAGVGAEMFWSSDKRNVGNGHQKIVASEDNSRVETELDFGDMGTAKAAFILEPVGEATKVTWTLLADMGTKPMGRWMGLMMDKWVGADYETGLSNLKKLVEG